MHKIAILIIEDNETDQRMLAKVLSKADYDLTFSPSKRDAVNLLVDGNYDFVITDLQLKNGFGFEILESIVKITQPFGIPVGVITGLYDAESAIRAVRELGISFYLDKNVMLAQKHPGLHPLLRIIAESIARAAHIASERATAAATINRLAAENERAQALLAATISDSANAATIATTRIDALSTQIHEQAVKIIALEKVKPRRSMSIKVQLAIIALLATIAGTIGTIVIELLKR